jgi:HSP20 family molecular chaperone IbpA
MEERPAPQLSTLFPLWHPDATLEESDDRLLIRIDMPGTRLEQVRVRVADDLLTVEADRRLDGERRGRGLVRSFLLPGPVPPEAVEGVLRDGVLTLTVDKRRRARPRRVPLS